VPIGNLAFFFIHTPFFLSFFPPLGLKGILKLFLNNNLNALTKRRKVAMQTDAPAFEALIKHGREWQHESWYVAGEDSKPEFYAFIAKAEQELKMVVGELDPELYEKPELVEACRRVLNAGATIQVIFNANVGTLSDAVTRLQQKNPSWVELKREYGPRLKLWWVSKRPVQHYAIVDDRNLLLEEHNHKPYGKRDVIFRYEDPKLARDYQQDFDEYTTEKAQEIDFASVD
jgi:hypothetical protein